MTTPQDRGIGREFQFWSLLRFAFPTMMMMVFTSLYVIVDGIFVSRFVSSDALASVNIVAPSFSLCMAAALMLSSGGSAIIARKMGLGDKEGARRDFTLIILVACLIALIFIVLGVFFSDSYLRALGASPRLMGYCKAYFIALLFFVPTYMLQVMFQTLFVTNGTPVLGMGLTVVAGLINMVLDYIFIVPMGMGIAGAALATGIGTMVPALYGIFYFLRKRGTLWFVKPKMDWRVLGQSCFNGSSEMVSNLAYGMITFLYNISMMRLIGEDGVAAITIIQYAEFLMNSLFFGFAMGVAPIFSYNYGSKNRVQTKRIFKICLVAVSVASLVVFSVSQIFGDFVVAIFAPKGSDVYALASRGFRIFSFCFLLTGANLFASALFTALSNGKISALISFLRTFIFVSGSILILPYFLGVTGIWIAVPLAEVLAFILSFSLVLAYRKEYGYL